MWGLGVGEIVMIAGALALLFGARKIPLLARGIGEGIRNFRGELKAGSAPRDEERPKLEDGERKEPRRGE